MRAFTASEYQNMRDGERRFRLVVEAAPIAMVMINREGEIVMVNAQAERVLDTREASSLVTPLKC